MHRALILAAAVLVPAPVGGDMSNTTVKAAGSTTARTQAERASDVVLAADYGAVGDRLDATSDLNVTASSTAATTTGTTFASTDCQTGTGCTGTHGNKIILIAGAGSTGYAHLTTIAGYVGPHAITLGNAAITTVANASFSYASNVAPQINAAITAAAARYPSGAKVVLGSGSYIINPALAQVTLASNMVLEAPGKGAANIICASLLDSATVAQNACVYGTGLTNIAVKSLTIKGVADLTPTRPVNDIGAPIFITQSTNVELSDNKLSYLRTYSLEVSSSTTVTINNNWVSYTFSSATGCGGCAGDILITNNHIDHAADAAVAVSSPDTIPPPAGVRNLIIANNSITESVGVQVSGGRSINISNNTFIRAIGQAIWVFPWTSFTAGDTPTSSVNIIGNTVQDVINHKPGTALVPSYDAYLIIGGGQRQAGSAPSVPGYPVSGSGVVTDLYGANSVGNFFQTGTNTATIPSPGSIGWNIADNVFIRTLPSVASYSQWGYGAAFWGAQPNVGTYTGAITEADLALNCITVREQALRLSNIHDNICATTGDYGIDFLRTNPLVGDYDQLKIHDNTFYDYNVAGVFFGATSATSSEIEITRNDFNADPRFRDSHRASGGVWSANSGPLGISSGFMSGLRLDKNAYRNLVSPYYLGAGPSAVWVGADETIFGLPAAAGFSASNIGVGVVSSISGVNNVFRLVCEDDNPQSATFGKITATNGLAQSAAPTTGCWLRGTFVTNTNGAPVDTQGRTLIGWQRITTNSSSNVLNTDWKEVYSAPLFTGTLAGTTGVVATSYTILGSDMGKLVSFNNASAIAVTLPTGGTAGFEQFKCFSLINTGAGLVTVTPTSALINGNATKTYATGSGGTVCGNGTNYLAY